MIAWVLKAYKQWRADALLQSGILYNDFFWPRPPPVVDMVKVRAALAAGANPNRRLNARKRFPLVEALSHFDPLRSELVSAFLAAGADPMGVPDSRYAFLDDCALSIVCQARDARSFVAMLESTSFAAHQSDWVLLGESTSLKSRGRFSNMPASWNLGMIAVQMGMPGQCLQAIQDNFERNVLPGRPDLAINHLWTQVDDVGRNSLTLALANPHPDLINFETLAWLLDHPRLSMREHLEHKDEYEQTVLWVAVNMDENEAITKLVGVGADIHVLNRDGMSIIEYLDGQGRGFPHPTADYLRSVIAGRAAMAAIDSALEEAQA